MRRLCPNVKTHTRSPGLPGRSSARSDGNISTHLAPTLQIGAASAETSRPRLRPRVDMTRPAGARTPRMASPPMTTMVSRSLQICTPSLMSVPLLGRWMPLFGHFLSALTFPSHLFLTRVQWHMHVGDYY